MQYEARVLSQSQQLQTVSVAALSPDLAREQLVGQGWTVLSVRQERASSRMVWSRRDGFDLLLFAQELQTLVAAGLSIVEALQALAERSADGTAKLVMERLLHQLAQGQRLSGALATEPERFPPLFVGVVQAAEGASDLPGSLGRYIAYESRLAALKHKVVSAAVYPSVLLVAGGGVALFLLGYVVPRFATVYQGSGRALPWASRVLLDWGVFVSQHTLLVAVVAACVGIAIAAWARVQLRTGNWWGLLRGLPGARQRLDVLELSRIYLTLGMLLEGGIPIVRALQLSRAVAGPVREQALVRVGASITQGKSLSSSLGEEAMVTPVSARLLRVGERSGQMGLMLGEAARFHEMETSRWIERFSKAFEPVLMAAIGIVIGLLVILLYMPIFELAGSLQ